jgi:parallel beta-helix repeat protein
MVAMAVVIIITARQFSGIAIWGPADHITISDNIVSNVPGSGIRVNKGDYISIINNYVFNNTWYTSAANSALVIAEAQSIDDNDTIKINILNNKVWGNQNKIPFYTLNPPDVAGEIRHAQ